MATYSEDDNAARKVVDLPFMCIDMQKENLLAQSEKMGDDIDEDDDEGMINSSVSAEDAFFDTVVGHIEDILMDEDFQTLQKNFLEKYWTEFEVSDENKLSYMAIFKEYNEVIEQHIEQHLLDKISWFSMDLFIEELGRRKADLDGEVFDMLFTFSDFLAFKEMFLDYRAMKEGTAVDLSTGIHITSGSLPSKEPKSHP